MRIDELYRRGAPVFSFEFFPPQSDAGAKRLMRTVEELREMLAPDFVSVTYGAGGSTRARTLELVRDIQNDLGLLAMAHLTCVGHSEEDLKAAIEDLVAAGISNILTLRGDPPKGETHFVPTAGGFEHASELAAFVRERFDVTLAGACYPEGHPESASLDQELEWTLHKVESGVNVLITQLFFDNDDYFRFVDEARAMGVEVPIVPGIMPITQVDQVERFTKLCGARIPDELLARLHQHRDDPAAVMAIGIEHAIAQCRALLERGAPGVHFYTLNKSHATRSVLAAIRAL